MIEVRIFNCNPKPTKIMIITDNGTKLAIRPALAKGSDFVRYKNTRKRKILLVNKERIKDLLIRLLDFFLLF